jgi:hypothetical protein
MKDSWHYANPIGYATRIIRDCEQCGKSFRTYPNWIKRGGGRFCSRSCANEGKKISPEIRFWAKVQKTEGCWIWCGGQDKNGYGIIRAGQRAHRRSWELHFGPVPKNLWILHHCDNPSCVRPDHLWLGTVTDNNADMIAKGRHRHGVVPPESRTGRPKGIIGKRTPGIPWGKPKGSKLSPESLARFRRKRGWDV